MDELKKPTALLVGSNIIFSVGSFMFLYKKMEQMQNDNNEMKQDILTLTNNMVKMSNDKQQTEEFLKGLNKDVKNLKTSVKDKNYENDIESIIDELSSNNIHVKLPNKRKKKTKTNKKKKYAFSSDEEEKESSEEEYNEIPYKTKTKSSYNNKKSKEELDDDDIINLSRQKK